MDGSKHDGFICSRTAAVISTVPPVQRDTLIQALVFAQIMADQQQVAKPANRWGLSQSRVLGNLGWAKVKEQLLEQSIDDELPWAAATTLQSFANLHLPGEQALAISELISQLMNRDAPPVLFSPTPAGSLVLAVVESDLRASVITAVHRAAVVALGAESEQEVPGLLQLSCTRYRIAADFWDMSAQLQSSVGAYVARNLRHLASPAKD